MKVSFCLICQWTSKLSPFITFSLCNREILLVEWWKHGESRWGGAKREVSKSKLRAVSGTSSFSFRSILSQLPNKEVFHIRSNTFWLFFLIAPLITLIHPLKINRLSHTATFLHFHFTKHDEIYGFTFLQLYN